MTKKERRRQKSALSSAPPEVAPLETSWDDTPPAARHDLAPESQSDRITAIPALPPELFAERMMADEADVQSDPFGAKAERNDASEHAESATHALTVRAQAMSAARQNELERAEASSRIVSPTGLELADLANEANAGQQRRTFASEIDLEFELSPPTQPNSTDPLLPDMKDRYATGDFSGALVIAESILETNPSHAEAQLCAERCREVLTQMYAERLGSLDQLVTVSIPSDQVRWLSLDHRAGFLLSVIDGGSTIEEILDISGMNRLDALRIMYQLLDQRVILLERRR